MAGAPRPCGARSITAAPPDAPIASAAAPRCTPGSELRCEPAISAPTDAPAPAAPSSPSSAGSAARLRLDLAATRSAVWEAARAAAPALPHLGDGWIAYREAQGYRPRWLLAHVDGDPARRTVAVGVAWLKRPRFRPWKSGELRLDRLPIACGGAAAERATPEALAAALVAAAAANRIGRIELESFDGPAPPPDLAPLCFAPRERFEFLLPLAGDEASRFARLKSSHRRKVRAAEKAQVTVADETGRTELALLRTLQGSTQERRADRGEEMELPDPRQYERLAATFVARGGGRLFVGRLGGEPVSAVLCGVERDRAYYLMGGTTPAGFECNAATLVLWRAACLLAATGITELNLGGVPRAAEQDGHPQHGLLRFKDGFEPMRIDCRSGTWESGR